VTFWYWLQKTGTKEVMSIQSGNWFQPVLCIFFSAQTLLVGLQKENPACKNNPCHVFPMFSFGTSEEREVRENWHGLT